MGGCVGGCVGVWVCGCGTVFAVSISTALTFRPQATHTRTLASAPVTCNTHTHTYTREGDNTLAATDRQRGPESLWTEGVAQASLWKLDLESATAGLWQLVPHITLPLKSDPKGAENGCLAHIM